MSDFKFRIGQTVLSPFGVVKIIHRWHGKSSTFYDVEFKETYLSRNTTKRDGVTSTKTCSLVEHEIEPFEAIGVDDVVEMISIEEIGGELIATFSVGIQVKIDDKIYSLNKKFQEKLVRV